MPRSILHLLLPLTLVWPVHAAYAQGKVQTNENIVVAAQAQKRRDGLRETLKAPVPEVDATKRRLSPQQRAELREQLRKQDTDHPK